MSIKRVQFDRYGGPSEMYLGEYDVPPVKRDQVHVMASTGQWSRPQLAR